MPQASATSLSEVPTDPDDANSWAAQARISARRAPSAVAAVAPPAGRPAGPSHGGFVPNGCSLGRRRGAAAAGPAVAAPGDGGPKLYLTFVHNGNKGCGAEQGLRGLVPRSSLITNVRFT